eukprot:6479767-Amphidinium_carterae.1
MSKKWRYRDLSLLSRLEDEVLGAPRRQFASLLMKCSAPHGVNSQASKLEVKVLGAPRRCMYGNPAH